MSTLTERLNNLISEYENSYLQKHRNYYFLRDMSVRFNSPKFKKLSSKQTKWFNQLIAEGISPKGDLELFNKITNAIKIFKTNDKEYEANILCDFIIKVYNNWDLSEKQNKFLHSLIAKAIDLELHGHWIPNDKMIKDLKLGVKFIDAYTRQYWDNHPGQRKAAQQVKNYICEKTKYLDEWAANKFIKLMNKKIHAFKNPKYEVGNLYWCHRPVINQAVMILEGPMIKDGTIRYKCLIDGQIYNNVYESSISKVRKNK